MTNQNARRMQCIAINRHIGLNCRVVYWYKLSNPATQVPPATQVMTIYTNILNSTRILIGYYLRSIRVQTHS